MKAAGRTGALLAALLLLIALASPGAFGVDRQPEFEDPQLQARYDRLINELRCLMCQNQTIADSNAGLAADLRREVRSMLLEGRSDAQIRDFMTERYGDFVLYRPPLTARTALLWALPLLLLVGGVIIAVRIVSQRARLVEGDPDEPAADRS